MYGLKNMLTQEQKHLEEILTKAQKSVKNSPQGKLRISMDDGRARYYHCIDKGNITYISKKNDQLPKQLAQKSYDKAVIKLAEKRLKWIQKCLKDYEDNEIEQIYKSMHIERQALVTPIEPSQEKMMEQWLADTYQGKKFLEDTPVITTEKGERVRSKSEKILADYFYRNNIPYKYEKPLYLNGYGIVYPDFTFYSKKFGKEIYWEHEGMMDKPDYARKAVKKINSYQKNGIIQGERLILTYETEQEMLNTKIVSILANKYIV